MDIDDLTIGQARELAAIFGDRAASAASAAPKPEPLACMVGKGCVVRSGQSGVWVGTIAAVCGDSVTLAPGARRAWHWTGAGSCSGLATTGPTGGKWPAPQAATTVVLGVCEVIEATPEALSAVAAQPVWSGRE